MGDHALEWILSHDETFRYQLLDRMRSDCVYYIWYERSCRGNHLWAGTVKDQISIMKGIWNSFPEDGKPEWLTLEQIETLEAEMKTVQPQEH